jgi:hypothetical protein
LENGGCKADGGWKKEGGRKRIKGNKDLFDKIIFIFFYPLPAEAEKLRVKI